MTHTKSTSVGLVTIRKVERFDALRSTVCCMPQFKSLREEKGYYAQSDVDCCDGEKKFM